MKRQARRVAALSAALLLAMSGLTVSAQTDAFVNTDDGIPLITEPEEMTEDLIYCRGDRDLAEDAISWADSTHGKAAYFNGVDEYFRLPYKAVQSSSFSLSMWVNWQGASTLAGGSGLDGQRIFSARSSQYGSRYATLSPMETTSEGTDALRLHVRYEDSDWELNRMQASPLTQSEWHHLVVVMSEEAVALYLDGVLMDEELTFLSPEQMELFQLYFGKGPTLNGDGYFHGFMDNVYLYKRALNVDEIRKLFTTQHPQAASSDAPSTDTTPSTPSAVTEQIAAPVQASGALPPIPPIVWVVMGATAALVVALIVTENVRYARQKKPPTE